MTLRKVTVGKREIAPGKIICVGRNYVAHIQELKNEMPEQVVFFLKPNSAITEVLHAFKQEPLHYEAEIGFHYENEKFTAVGVGLDITKRALQSDLKKKGLPWERAKAFDGSVVFSPFVEIASVTNSLRLELDINQHTIQTGGIDLMLHKPYEILSELNSFMSLNDGDIVMTGTPAGVGVVQCGDVFTGRILDGTQMLVEQTWCAK